MRRIDNQIKRDLARKLNCKYYDVRKIGQGGGVASMTHNGLPYDFISHSFRVEKDTYLVTFKKNYTCPVVFKNHRWEGELKFDGKFEIYAIPTNDSD